MHLVVKKLSSFNCWGLVSQEILILCCDLYLRCTISHWLQLLFFAGFLTLLLSTFVEECDLSPFEISVMPTYILCWETIWFSWFFEMYHDNIWNDCDQYVSISLNPTLLEWHDFLFCLSGLDTTFILAWYLCNSPHSLFLDYLFHIGTVCSLNFGGFCWIAISMNELSCLELSPSNNNYCKFLIHHKGPMLRNEYLIFFEE